MPQNKGFVMSDIQKEKIRQAALKRWAEIKSDPEKLQARLDAHKEALEKKQGRWYGAVE